MLRWRHIVSLIWKSWKQQSLCYKTLEQLRCSTKCWDDDLSTPWRHPSSVKHIDTELSMIICFQEFSFTVTSLGIIIFFTSCILRPEDVKMIYPDLPYDTGPISASKCPLKHLCRNILYLDATPFCTFVLKFVSTLRIYKSFKIIRGICQLYMKYM